MGSGDRKIAAMKSGTSSSRPSSSSKMITPREYNAQAESQKAQQQTQQPTAGNSPSQRSVTGLDMLNPNNPADNAVIQQRVPAQQQQATATTTIKANDGRKITILSGPAQEYPAPYSPDYAQKVEMGKLASGLQPQKTASELRRELVQSETGTTISYVPGQPTTAERLRQEEQKEGRSAMDLGKHESSAARYEGGVESALDPLTSSQYKSARFVGGVAEAIAYTPTAVPRLAKGLATNPAATVRETILGTSETVIADPARGVGQLAGMVIAGKAAGKGGALVKESALPKVKTVKTTSVEVPATSYEIVTGFEKFDNSLRLKTENVVVKEPFAYKAPTTPRALSARVTVTDIAESGQPLKTTYPYVTDVTLSKPTIVEYKGQTTLARNLNDVGISKNVYGQDITNSKVLSQKQGPYEVNIEQMRVPESKVQTLDSNPFLSKAFKGNFDIQSKVPLKELSLERGQLRSIDKTGIKTSNVNLEGTIGTHDNLGLNIVRDVVETPRPRNSIGNIIEHNALSDKFIGETLSKSELKPPETTSQYIRGRFLTESNPLQLSETSGKTGKLVMVDKKIVEGSWEVPKLDQFRSTNIKEGIPVPGESNTFTPKSTTIYESSKKGKISTISPDEILDFVEPDMPKVVRPPREKMSLLSEPIRKIKIEGFEKELNSRSGNGNYGGYSGGKGSAAIEDMMLRKPQMEPVNAGNFAAEHVLRAEPTTMTELHSTIVASKASVKPKTLIVPVQTLKPNLSMSQVPTQMSIQGPAFAQIQVPSIKQTQVPAQKQRQSQAQALRTSQVFKQTPISNKGGFPPKGSTIKVPEIIIPSFEPSRKKRKSKKQSQDKSDWNYDRIVNKYNNPFNFKGW
jgi:hypothetical protein